MLPQKAGFFLKTVHSLIFLLPGNCLRIKHSKSNIDLIHADRFFSLLKLTDKSESETGTQSELLLRQAACSGVSLYAAISIYRLYL